MSLHTGPGSEVATTTRVVRVMNERAVYEQVRALGTVSAAQLVASTGLSKPTVALALADLERTGLIRQVGLRTGGVGRAPRVFQVRPEAGWVMAIDIGRAWLRAALADVVGNVVVRRDVRSEATSRSALISRIGDLAHTVADEAGIGWKAVTHTVVGSPGVYEPDRGLVRLTPNLPGWERPGVDKALRSRLGADVTIENDINLAALGESAHGLGRNVDAFVFLSVGTGIGMGVVIDGKLWRGAHGAAGEIGFLPTAIDDAVPAPSRASTRRRGMLESVASANAVVSLARRAGSLALSSEEVFAAARAGEHAALSAVDAEAALLARAVASVTAIVDPRLVVLGGGVGRDNGDLLVNRIKENLARFTPLYAPDIVVSSLGNDAVVLGGLAAGLGVARRVIFERAVSGST